MTTESNYEDRFAEAAKTITDADNIRYNDYINRLLEVGLVTDKERDRIVTRHNKWMEKYCGQGKTHE